MIIQILNQYYLFILLKILLILFTIVFGFQSEYSELFHFLNIKMKLITSFI